MEREIMADVKISWEYGKVDTHLKIAAAGFCESVG